MDSMGREEFISTIGVAGSSPESRRRWEPEMAIMANNGGKKMIFSLRSSKAPKTWRRKPIALIPMKEKHRHTMYTYSIEFLMCYLLGFVRKT